jgi:hypothetical protein
VIDHVIDQPASTISAIILDGFYWLQQLISEQASRFTHINSHHPLWLMAHKGILISVIVIIVPVNAIILDVFYWFIVQGVDASGAILHHTEKEHIPRASLLFTMNTDFVAVPCLSPI